MKQLAVKILLRQNQVLFVSEFLRRNQVLLVSGMEGIFLDQIDWAELLRQQQQDPVWDLANEVNLANGMCTAPFVSLGLLMENNQSRRCRL